MSSHLFRVFDEQHFMDPILAETSKTLNPKLQEQLKNKYRTFTRFNYREAFVEAKQSRKKKSEITKALESDIGLALQLFLKNSLAPENQLDKKGKSAVFQELPGVKSERRERFKRGVNTFLLIKHYIEKENFKPSQEEMYLMKQLAEIKENSDHSSLDQLLKKIYRIMNEAVDLNEMRFLSLLILLAADVCFQFREFNRSFYFYNQARIFASYSQLYQIKVESLIQMGAIAIEIKDYTKAVTLFKKALQYAWKIRSHQSQLLIYDYIGNCYYYQGNIKESQYFHRRFAQGQFQQNDSAIKRLSIQMLNEYQQHLKSLQTQHLTSLFLEYIKIPIVDHTQIAPPSKHRNKIYENYDEEGNSPRKKRVSRIYELQDYSDVGKQLNDLINEDYQFITEIPHPDVQQNFIVCQKFGRPRKEISFQQSAECHKILQSKQPKIDLKSLQVNTFERRLQKALSSRSNNDWWDQMKDRIRKNQVQNLGTMKDRIFNSHQSYCKYPEERRRAHSLKGEKIKQSFNKTLLDWIDPIK